MLTYFSILAGNTKLKSHFSTQKICFTLNTSKFKIIGRMLDANLNKNFRYVKLRVYSTADRLLSSKFEREYFCERNIFMPRGILHQFYNANVLLYASKISSENLIFFWSTGIFLFNLKAVNAKNK